MGHNSPHRRTFCSYLQSEFSTQADFLSVPPVHVFQGDSTHYCVSTQAPTADPGSGASSCALLIEGLYRGTHLLLPCQLLSLFGYDVSQTHPPPSDSTPSRDVVEEMASNLEVYASAAPIILRNICTGSGPILPSPSPPLPNASPCSQAGPPRPYLPSLRRLRLLLRSPLPLQRAWLHTPIFVEN